ncbi:S-layer homology domain-containing protein [Paenibacillus donghaensis]|uniref:SLH domain-containing protein n=1 Tax=Paenibacillus donghaensis TaxID=414771 RepID=A0A2Z2KU67_9BACL|nr:S-layer homology domain-containing protein [Paenibacillus donghaensis]ASA23228.1 hypothetical protein B9T62_21915 [Paenibacillus donghaensis]
MRDYKTSYSLRTAVIILLSMLLALPGTALAANVQPAAAAASFTSEMQAALQKAEAVLLAAKPFPDEAAAGFARNGSKLTAGYQTILADRILDKRGKFDTVTELSRTGLNYGAAGGNANNIAGIDLFPLLMNHPGMEKEGAEGIASAYILSNNMLYQSANRPNYYPDMLFYMLLQLQSADGSWPDADSGQASVAVTAQVLTAVAPSRTHEEAAVQIPRALQWLREQQQDGRFGGSTADTARVVIALSALEIDAASFKQPDGLSPLEYLLSRSLPAGGFAQTAGGAADTEATVQAYLALTAYKLLSQKAAPLYSDLGHSTLGTGTIQIEGPEGTLALGRMAGGPAMKAATRFMNEQGIPYKLSTSAVPQISAINGIRNGQYNGRGEWRLALMPAGRSNWLFPEVISAELQLNQGDRLLLYYSDNTVLFDQLDIQWKDKAGSITHGNPPAKTSFDLYVKKAQPQLSYLPAAGVTVSVQGQTAVTDAKGKASFSGLPPGIHPVQLTRYVKGAAPAIAKRVVPLQISSPEMNAYPDAAKVAGWASSDVSMALSLGYLQGVSDKGKLLLAPKKSLTRAEFVTLLLRQLGEFPDSKTVSGFKDVRATAWYSGAVATAAELGIVQRSSGVFEPGRAITRLEAATMVVNAAGLQTFGSAGRTSFTDTTGLSAASLKAIQIVNEHGIMTGSGGKFQPGQTLVREQAAAILLRMDVLAQK